MPGKMNFIIIDGGFLNFRRREELTLNLKYNVDSPSTSCDRCDNLILVPNGKTGSTHECMPNWGEDN